MDTTPFQPKDPKAVQKAIGLGQSLIDEGKSKVEVTRAIYPLIQDEPREVIWQTFMAGASLTEKGAITYYYNVKRGPKKKGGKKEE